MTEFHNEVDLGARQKRADRSIRLVVASRVVGSILATIGGAGLTNNLIETQANEKEAIEQLYECMSDPEAEICSDLSDTVDKAEPMSSKEKIIWSGISGLGLLVLNAGFVYEARYQRRIIGRIREGMEQQRPQ